LLGYLCEKKMRCIIVEENPRWTETLKGFIQRTPMLELVHVFNNPVEAIIAKNENEADLLLTGTRLPYLNGFELARKLERITRVIFMGESKNEAFDAFECKAVDFLLKPFDFPRFEQAIQSALRLENTPHNEINRCTSREIPFFWVKSDYQYIKIATDKLLYIEGLKDYLKLYLKEKEKPVLTLGSLKKIEEKLPPGKFLRVHRSFIISLDNIDSFQRNLIKIGNTKIAIGEHYKNQFFEKTIGNSLL